MNDEEEISRMLASLRSVDAPREFEGGVRSRITARREESTLWRPSRFLVLKFALPLLLLLAGAGFLIVSNDGALNADLVPPVGDATHSIAIIDDKEVSVPDGPSPTNVNSPIAQVSTHRGGGNARTVPQGGSADIGLSPDNSTSFPDGVDPRNSKITNGKPPTGGAIAPESVLLMIGILSTCSSTGCVANSVRVGSIAAGAGIQDGDWISAIDGRPIKAGGVTGQFSVSEITLVRSGRIMKVPIGRP
ncbi:MAG: hypothetical protein ABIR33_00920 [Pyrinomonadaceae bacterium]